MCALFKIFLKQSSDYNKLKKSIIRFQNQNLIN